MVKPRDLSDRAYVEAHRDDLLSRYIEVGHSEDWISVLMGERPGILLPRGQVDTNELTRLRDLIKQDFILDAPEAVFSEELAQWLSDDQLYALSIGKPVLFTQLVERHLRPAEPRANTNLVSRYRNSAEFGIAISLFYIGLLIPEEQKTVTEEGAVKFAIDQLCEKKPFSGWLRRHTNPIGFLENKHKDGKRANRISNYYGVKSVNDEIRARVRVARLSKATRLAELRFWLTVFSAVLKTFPQPDKQVVSHNLLSRAARAMLPFPRPEWLNFRGDRRAAADELDLIALAYLDLPDVARIFPNKAASAPRFRASAALGRLSRGLLTRLTAAEIDLLVRLEKPVPEASSMKTQVSASLPQLMTADEFLFHAKYQIADDVWWFKAFVQPLDQEQTLHLRRDDPVPISNAEGSAGHNEAELQFFGDPIRRSLGQFIADHEYTLHDRELAAGRLFAATQRGNEHLAILDVRAHRKFRDQQYARLVESFFALAVTCTRALLGPGQLQAEDKFKPGFSREQVRIAAALKIVLADRQPEIIGRLESDIKYHSSALTDRERDACCEAGEFTGELILEFLRRQSV